MFANTFGNGFALDDNWFLVENPVVTEARFSDAFLRASWPGALEGTGNYRPLALSSFALEWSLWGDAPMGYHVVSVLVNGLVAVLAFFLLRAFFTPFAAGLGAVFFAIHPVHVEAVANVMGRSELYAALGYFGACLVYQYWRPTGHVRGARLLAILLLFLVALGGKEIAVTLPAMLLALEVYGGGTTDVVRRLRREALTYIGVFALMACYVVIRWNVLGDVTGESAAAGLASLDARGRVLTALAVWPHYLRLLFFPLDLSADYSPAVLMPRTSVDDMVLLGGAILIATCCVAVLAWRRAPLIGFACAWFVIAISPVSNLVVRADVLLAERTLFLPSFGAALAVAWVTRAVLERPAGTPAARRVAIAGAVVVGVLLSARTVTRNPTWFDTITVFETLNEEHPESWMTWRIRAIGLDSRGESDRAAEAWETALSIAPDHYQLLVDAAEFFERTGQPERSERLLDRAVELLPGHPVAYQRLAEYRIRRGDGRGAHAAAAVGLRAARPDPEIWALLSETYVMKADLEAAVRARRASIDEEETEAGWLRLADLYDALGRREDADVARRAALQLRRG